MKRRRLRKLVPDAELIRRRAAGEPLRGLASDYGVAHTTLGRYFERPEIAKQLKEAARLLRAAQRASDARRSAERRLEQEVRKKAREQAVVERRAARRSSAVVREIMSRPRRARSEYAAWLDERDAAMPLTRADLHSQLDDIAADAVATGGGMQAVLDATDLRTLENVVGSIDPAILTQAFDNDALARVEPPPLQGVGAEALQRRMPKAGRLRRLVPDAELIRRRAAGEPLRELAPDYDVTHTTLGRYFQRPEVKKQLKQASEQLRAAQRAAAARRAAERRQEQELRREARKQAATGREVASPFALLYARSLPE